MKEYIKKLLEGVPYDMNGTAKTPEANHLLNVNNRAMKLPRAKAEFFYHIVAKLLYLCRRTQQDIQTAIAFLCTRLKNLDKVDYKKLTRVIQYIRDTQDITLTIEADDSPHWWVDCSYVVHPLAAQGIPEPTTIIYQDNKSTILQSENGRLSSTK